MTTAGGTARLRAVQSRGQGWLRPLVVLALVAGVLSMHALTVGNQRGPVPSAGSSSSASGAAMHVTGHPPDSVAAAMAGVNLAGWVDAVGCTGCGDEGPGSSHTGSHLLDLCVAVLLAGTVTMLLLLARRPRGRDRLRVVLRAVGLPKSSRRLRPPALSQLCVLRT